MITLNNRFLPLKQISLSNKRDHYQNHIRKRYKNKYKNVMQLKKDLQNKPNIILEIDNN